MGSKGEGVRNQPDMARWICWVVQGKREHGEMWRRVVVGQLEEADP